METKQNNMFRKVTSLFVIVLMMSLSIDSAFSLNINNVEVDASNRYAKINWQTDLPSTSSVDYGINGTLTSTKSSGQLVTNHTLLISPLQNTTSYSFNVT